MKNRKIHNIVKLEILTTIILIAMNTTIFNQTVLSDDEVYRLIDQIPGQEATMVGQVYAAVEAGGGLGGFLHSNFKYSVKHFDISKQCGFDNLDLSKRYISELDRNQVDLSVEKNLQVEVLWSDPDVGISSSNIKCDFSSMVDTAPNTLVVKGAKIRTRYNSWAQVFHAGTFPPGQAPVASASGHTSVENTVTVPFRVLYSGIVEMDIEIAFFFQRYISTRTVVGTWKIKQGSNVLYQGTYNCNNGNVGNVFDRLLDQPIEGGDYILIVTYNSNYAYPVALAQSPSPLRDSDYFYQTDTFSIEIDFHIN